MLKKSYPKKLKKYQCYRPILNSYLVIKKIYQVSMMNLMLLLSNRHLLHTRDQLKLFLLPQGEKELTRTKLMYEYSIVQAMRSHIFEINCLNLQTLEYEYLGYLCKTKKQ